MYLLQHKEYHLNYILLVLVVYQGNSVLVTHIF
jgi:hypothetical protein